MTPASGEGLPINMTTESWRSYHVGRTTFSYSTTCEGGNCTTIYTVEGDGFWDIFWGEDNTGSDGELGGTPYSYNSPCCASQEIKRLSPPAVPRLSK